MRLLINRPKISAPKHITFFVSNFYVLLTRGIYNVSLMHESGHAPREVHGWATGRRVWEPAGAGAAVKPNSEAREPCGARLLHHFFG